MLLIFIRAAVWSDAERIAAGDPVERVYRTLGTPTLEFPLNGDLIQQYEHCTIVSRNGIVCSAEYRKTEKAAAEQAEEKPSSPSVSDVLVRAENGDPESQYLLAYNLQSGQVIEQDYAKAVQWYTRAAIQGYMPAQHNLGVLYMTGEGVAQDYEEAYVWALLAAENGNDSLMKAVRPRLSREQRQSGELRAKQILTGSDAEPPDTVRNDDAPAPQVTITSSSDQR